MAGEIIPLDRIRREAIEAAARFSTVNEACPYPFGTDAAHAFCSEFRLAKNAVQPQRGTSLETGA